jgi:hypothetical protein
VLGRHPGHRPDRVFAEFDRDPCGEVTSASWRLKLGDVAVVLLVSDAGLRVLAAHCEMVSAELVAATLPSVGLPIQATSAAVGAAHAAVDATITVLGRRAQTSAVKSAVAGAQFAMTDAAGAQQVAAIGASLSQV